MYKIKIYKDLGFDNKNQRFFTYSDNFEPTLLLKSLTCESVFNGARTTVDVKTAAGEFQDIFVYAHNIIIENEKQRPLFFYVQNAEQITRDTIRFYLEKDYFHSYFNNKFAGSVTGWVAKCNHKQVLSRRGSGIVPLFSRVSTAKTLLTGNTDKQCAVGLFATSTGYFMAIADDHVHDYTTANDWISFFARVKQFQTTVTYTPTACKCVARWKLPYDFVENMSNFNKINSPAFQISDNTMSVTSPRWYNAFSVDRIMQRDYSIKNATFLETYERNYIEIGTPFTRTEFKMTPYAETKFSILVLAQVNQFSIYLKVSNKMIDLAADFQVPMISNDSAREYDEFALYRTVDRWATVISNANSLQKNVYSVNNWQALGKSILSFQERDLANQLTFSTVTGSGNGLVVHSIDKSYSFGLFFTPPDNSFTADLCFNKLRDADGELTLDGDKNEYANTFSIDGELYVEMHNVKIKNIPKEAENAIKSMFENGIFIQYEKTT